LTWIDVNAIVSDDCYYECKLNKGKQMRNIFDEIVDGFKHLAKQRDDMDGAGISNEGWDGCYDEGYGAWISNEGWHGH
jgi:hypothetical protein